MSLKFFALLAIFFLIHNSHALADYLDERTDRLILQNSKADTSRTDKEKLFKYRCEYIEKYVGFDSSTSGQATKYSCDKPEVGIALYAGKDLGEHSPEKVGNYFKKELLKHHVNAKIFIKEGHPYGSSMAFYINGESWLRDSVNVAKGIEMIEKLAAETLLILYTEKRISEWPKEAISQKK